MNQQQKKVLLTTVMSIYSQDYGMAIIQDFIGEKNEIPMDPKLINQLNLSDSIITAYALNRQKKQ